MRCATIFGLTALLPAALNAAVPASGRALSVALCNGGSITLPLGPEQRDDEGSGTKACHAGCSRKRSNRLY